MNHRWWNPRPLPWPFLSNELSAPGFGMPESHIVVVAVRDPRLRPLEEVLRPRTRLAAALAPRKAMRHAAGRGAVLDSDWPVTEAFERGDLDDERDQRNLELDEAESFPTEFSEAPAPRGRSTSRANASAVQPERERPAEAGEQGKNPMRTRVPRFRPLFVEPGLSRIVSLGDFKEQLAPQLAHPDRLRNSHRLPCRVQVYEALSPVRMRMLAAIVFGSSERVSQLRRFEGDAIAQLGLTELPPSRALNSSDHAPEILRRFERVFRLEVTEDPTRIATRADAHATDSTGRVESAAPTAGSGLIDDIVATLSKGATPRAHTEEQGAAQVPGVPERYLRRWEFQRSREEAVYDMQTDRAARGPLAALRRKLSGRKVRADDLRRWQVLLRGKTIEEQLWSVRPPQHGLCTRTVREWAELALATAGYSSATMIDEWEIFWRRKGV